MKTKTVVVSYEISCANEDEVISAEYIVRWNGSCVGLSCCDCPFNDDYACAEDSYEQRLIIAKAMLGEDNE